MSEKQQQGLGLSVAVFLLLCNARNMRGSNVLYCFDGSFMTEAEKLREATELKKEAKEWEKFNESRTTNRT